MTFRRRLALLVAAAVVIVGAAVVGSVYLVVRAQLRDQVETELHELAEVVRAASPSGSLPVPRGAQAPSPPNVPRIVDADGTVVQSRMPGLMLPVTAEAQAVAAGTRESSLETLRLGPDRYAVVTLPLGSSRAVQIARSLAPVDDLLSRLLRMSLATGGAVVVLAPFIGYVVAGGGLVPVRRLSRTAEGVAKTGDLRQRADVHGNDELASLASSFNAMLDRLEAMVDTLERAQRAQRQLVADASHELRTPLATLRANVEFLTLGSAGSGTDRSEVATDTLAQIDDLTALVGQLIDLAREDERRPEQTPVRLDHVVDNALERARQHHPAVSFAVDLEHTTVLGAEDALSRAVANLLDNAGNWSPAGATVKVRLHGGVLEVRDQGPGIDPTDLPYVFDRFYRGAHARGSPGSGLGLAIVGQVASSHGGKAWAEQAPGGGALVQLRLPTVDP